MKRFYLLLLLTCIIRSLCAYTEDELSKIMRELWADHSLWIREYVIADLSNHPSAPFVLQRLMKNQEHIGNAFIPFYGEAKGKKLTSLLKKHINHTVGLIDAAKKNDAKERKKQTAEWHKNEAEIATFLSKINCFLPKNIVVDSFNQHFKLNARQVELRLKKRWEDDIENYDEIRMHLNHFADELTQAIVLQFPEKFVLIAAPPCELD